MYLNDAFLYLFAVEVYNENTVIVESLKLHKSAPITFLGSFIRQTSPLFSRKSRKFN